MAASPYEEEAHPEHHRQRQGCALSCLTADDRRKMTTEDHLVVDCIAQADDGSVTLIMVEPREWTDVALMLADIEKKLTAYVTFVIRGGLAAQPSLKPTDKIRIDLSCQHVPPASVQPLFEQALAFTTSRKIDFTVSQVVAKDVPPKRLF